MKTDSSYERPASLYDNLRPGGSLHSSGALSVGNLTSVGVVGATPRDHSQTLGRSDHHPHPHHHQYQLDRLKSPSQANCLSTTVPQNIAAPALSGRHTPTRSSLRHSRMIVLSRYGSVPRKYQPPILYQHRLAKCLVGLQTLVGAAVLTVSSWIYIYSPSVGYRDIPFWSGVPLFLSGIMGLMLLCCCRKDYPGYPLSCWVFSFKVTSLTISAIAGVATFCATTFATIHILSLQSMVCEPEDTLSATTCVCRTVSVDYVQERPYPHLSCPEVKHMLQLLLVTSAVVNFIGGVLVVWYLYLHWSSRYSYVYSKVRTGENKPMVISNKL